MKPKSAQRNILHALVSWIMLHNLLFFSSLWIMNSALWIIKSDPVGIQTQDLQNFFWPHSANKKVHKGTSFMHLFVVFVTPLGFNPKTFRTFSDLIQLIKKCTKKLPSCTCLLSLWLRWDSNPRPSEPESDALFS